MLWRNAGAKRAYYRLLVQSGGLGLYRGDSRLRCRLLQVVKDILNLSDADIARLLPDSDQLFASVMGSQQKEVIDVVSDYLWDAFRMREQLSYA